MSVSPLRMSLVLTLLASLLPTFPVAIPPVPSRPSLDRLDSHTQRAPTASGTITKLGSYNTPGLAQRVQAVGALAYVADGSSGMQVIDITNPMSPALAATYGCSDSCYDLQIVDNLAYLKQFPNFDYDRAELQILDISNPRSPRGLGSVPTNGFSEFQVAGGFAYVVEDADPYTSADNALLTVDVHDPRRPLIRGRVSLSKLTRVTDIQVVGNLVYLIGSKALDGELQIVDVSNPDNPALRGAIGELGGMPVGVGIANGYAYVPIYVDRNNGAFSIIDIHDPDQPMLAHKHSLSGTPPTDFEMISTRAYVVFTRMGAGYVEVVDVGNHAAPSTLVSGGHLTNFHDIQVVGNRIYVADGSAGLQILEVDLPQPAHQVFLPAIVR